MPTLLTLRPAPKDYLELASAYSTPVVAQLRAMPGLSWDTRRRVWRGPREAVEETVSLLEAAGLVVVRGGEDGRTDPEPQNGWLLNGLYPYQQAGVEFVRDRVARFGAVWLADDPGLGKSAQALRASRADSLLILCPAVVVRHWIEQVTKWLGLSASVLDRKHPWDGSGIAVASYDTFRGLEVQARASEMILDELHYLANSKSARAKAVRKYIADGGPARPSMIGLSGTPLRARPRDLWNPLDLLFPGRFGSFFAFTGRYANGRYVEIPGLEKPVWSSEGASHLDELGRRLKAVILRRERAEVLDLPARQRIALPVDLPVKALKAARESAALARDAESLSRALSVIEEHKIDAARELVYDLRAAGKRVLVYTTRRETARQIAEALGVVAVTGEMDSGTRKAALIASDVGVATVYSVTTGIDLVDFDVAVFVGLDWLPSTLEQAEARIYRIGQVRPVTIYYLIGIGTLDEAVRSRVVERLDYAGRVVGGDADGAALGAALNNTIPEDDPLLAALLAAAKEHRK